MKAARLPINGGILLRDLRMPDFRDCAVEVPAPGIRVIGDTHVLGPFLRDVAKLNSEQRNFRVFGPDETLSNGLEALFEVTKRQWDAATVPNDEFLAPAGRVMEMLSEHQCEGWLEGYLLTGRHGLFNCYEAFIHIVDSMFNQHAKWLKVTAHLPWRRKIASLNYLLASHVWRQDHNGFTHQDPGFIDHVVNKKAEVVRVYLPPDANCLLSVVDHCLRSRHYVNVVVAGKHPAPQWLTMDAAVKHCTEGIAPAIAIKQKNATRNPRSTVATATEIYDYLRLLSARAGRTFCTRCGNEVRRDTIDEITTRVPGPEAPLQPEVLHARLACEDFNPDPLQILERADHRRVLGEELHPSVPAHDLFRAQGIPDQGLQKVPQDGEAERLMSTAHPLASKEQYSTALGRRHTFPPSPPPLVPTRELGDLDGALRNDLTDLPHGLAHSREPLADLLGPLRRCGKEEAAGRFRVVQQTDMLGGK